METQQEQGTTRGNLVAVGGPQETWDGAVAPAAEGESTHEEIRQQVLSLRDRTSDDNWALAAALHAVHAHSYYLGWGFATWPEYIEQEVDFELRKAQMLVRIEEWLGGLPDKAQRWIRAMGWSKTRLLVNVVTAENADEWKNRVSGRSYRQIEEEIHGEKQGARDSGATGEGEGAGADDLHPWKAQMSDAQRIVVEQALEAAARVAGVDVEGHIGYLLHLMATEYLNGAHEFKTMSEYLDRVGASLRVRLVAYDPERDEIVYGDALLDEMAAQEAAPKKGGKKQVDKPI